MGPTPFLFCLVRHCVTYTTFQEKRRFYKHIEITAVTNLLTLAYTKATFYGLYYT